jgi:TRAP-type C4-dicarboxylate transport system substrate-binding protein
MRHTVTTLLAALFLVVSGPVDAAGTTLRIATVAPAGSSFHKSLQELAAQWRQAPGGGVTLDVYPGTQGGEAQIARRMRVGQLQGAMLTANGLGEIHRESTALQLMPMMFRDWDEVDYVRENLSDRLENGLLESGYVVLFWGDAGWVRFFSTRPIRSGDDLRSMHVYADGNDPAALSLMRDYYTPVPLDPDKILLGLRNDMIDAVPMPAFLANFMQVAVEAPYMLDMRWVPIVGAMVVTRRAWESLPAETREFLLRTGREAGVKIRAQARAEDEAAIDAMRSKQKLQVVPFTPQAEAEWRGHVERIYPRLRGSVVPAATYDAVVDALRSYQRKTAAAGPAGTNGGRGGG